MPQIDVKLDVGTIDGGTAVGVVQGGSGPMQIGSQQISGDQVAGDKIVHQWSRDPAPDGAAIVVAGSNLR